MSLSAEAKAAVASLLVFVLVVVLLPMAEKPVQAPREFDLSSLVSQIPPLDVNKIAGEVSRIVKLKTVSAVGPVPADSEPTHLPEASQAAMKEAHALLKTTYPKLFAASKVETVNDFSLLLTLEGSDPSLKPAMVIGHLDVVPIEAGTESDWGKSAGCQECTPFSGAIHGGYVWGRGALDMKSFVVCFLHAAEALLSRPEGFKPRRTILIGVGHDEEVGGNLGHRKIADVIKARGIQGLEFLLDEGMPILQRGTMSLNKGFELALIGTAEKGFVSVELSCEYSGGHAAYPDVSGTSVSILSRAVARIQANPPAPVLRRPMSDMVQTVAPSAGFPLSFLGSRLSFFGPLVARVLTATPRQAAAVRTTAAATMVGGGTKENVLPQKAWAVINHRIVPGETVEEVVERDRQLADDPRIKVKVHGGRGFVVPPSAVSDTDAFGFQVIAGSIRQLWPAAVVSPGLFIAASDSKHYEQHLAPARVYRPLPPAPRPRGATLGTGALPPRPATSSQRLASDAACETTTAESDCANGGVLWAKFEVGRSAN